MGKCNWCKYFKDDYCDANFVCVDGDRFVMAESDGDSIKTIAIEIADIVERKNNDYGNSFDKTIKEYGDVAYFLRIEDKLSRLKSLSNKSAEVDESIEDTLKDIIGYTLLMISNKRKVD